MFNAFFFAKYIFEDFQHICSFLFNCRCVLSLCITVSVSTERLYVQFGKYRKLYFTKKRCDEVASITSRFVLTQCCAQFFNRVQLFFFPPQNSSFQQLVNPSNFSVITNQFITHRISRALVNPPILSCAILSGETAYSLRF